MKAIAYCRVSTVAQGEDGVSLEMQRDRIAGWCVGNGYEQEAVFVETMSGGRASNRPELQEALSMACKAASRYFATLPGMKFWSTLSAIDVAMSADASAIYAW